MLFENETSTLAISFLIGVSSRCAETIRLLLSGPPSTTRSICSGGGGREPGAVKGLVIRVLESVPRRPRNPGKDVGGDAFELDSELEIGMV